MILVLLALGYSCEVWHSPLAATPRYVARAANARDTRFRNNWLNNLVETDMELNLNHPYETGLEQVLGIFLTEDHILGKNARLGARNVSILELVRDEGSAKLVFEREMQSSNEVPGILASFHREWNRIRQEEHWVCKDEGEWHCEFRVHIEGVPAKIKGTMRLHGDSAACTNSITLDVRCEIPLLGKKIAKFLLDDSCIKIGQEHQATLAML